MPSSAFFTKPEDYIHEAPYTHPLLTELVNCTWFVHRLTIGSSDHVPDYPHIRNQVKSWREKMFQALMLFYQDVKGQPGALSRLTPDPKVSMLRVFHAIQTYAALIQQIREARTKLEASQAHAEAANVANLWLEMWTDLRTVEYRMKRFIKRGEMPKDKDINTTPGRGVDRVPKSLIHDSYACLSSNSSPEGANVISEPLQSYSDQSAFFDLPEDYGTVPFSHRILQPLLSAKEGLERIAQLQTPPLGAAPSPLEHLTAWRREMCCALAAFYRDVFETSTLKNIATCSSSKVGVVRALFAMRCYAILVKQIDATKQALCSVPDASITSKARLAALTDLETVKVRMDQFFMKKVKPVDQDVFLGEAE